MHGRVVHGSGVYVHGRGCAWQGGACVAGGGMRGRGEECPAGEMAIAVSGTHPTGMHPCLSRTFY